MGLRQGYALHVVFVRALSRANCSLAASRVRGSEVARRSPPIFSPYLLLAMHDSAFRGWLASPLRIVS
jgi:hypothetical protein